MSMDNLQPVAVAAPRGITRMLRKLVMALCVALPWALPVAAQPIQIVNLLELSGAGASVGTNMKHGAEIAVREINAAGAFSAARSR